MIKRTGYIYNLTPGASRAVQFQLFEKGMKWHDEDATNIVATDTLYWDGHYLMTYLALSGFEPHTLRDFNLREDGTQLVPNEGACDLRGCSEGVRREVEKLVSEALGIKWIGKDYAHANTFLGGYLRWDKRFMHQSRPEDRPLTVPVLAPSDLGIHEPDQSEASDKTSAIKVGSPALDNKKRPCTILAIAEGYALCRYQDTPEQKHPVRAVELRKLRPASYTVDLSESLMAIVELKGVTIEGITFSLDALNKLVDAADDLINPKTAKS